MPRWPSPNFAQKSAARYGNLILAQGTEFRYYFLESNEKKGLHHD
jgi:hypothetical protein